MLCDLWVEYAGTMFAKERERLFFVLGSMAASFRSTWGPSGPEI
jgi:hypothetical protein